jgi:hypothetical protein
MEVPIPELARQQVMCPNVDALRKLSIHAVRRQINTAGGLAMVAREFRISARVLPPWQAWVGSVFIYQNATHGNPCTNRPAPTDLCYWFTSARGS